MTKETSYKLRQDVGIYLLFWGLIYIGLSTFCDDEVKRYTRTAGEILFCIAHPIFCWILGVAMSGAYGKHKHQDGLPKDLTNPTKAVRYRLYPKVPVIGKIFLAFLIATGIRYVLIPKCTRSIFIHLTFGVRDILEYNKTGNVPSDMESEWRSYQERKKGVTP